MVSRKKTASPRAQKPKKLILKRLNPLLTCKICKGYLVDATTVTECLHTFCKSCIVKYLERNNNCPTCKIVIHQSHPLNYISLDRTLQQIVYKVVPGLCLKQRDEEEHFYRSKNLEPPVSHNRFTYTDFDLGIENSNTKKVVPNIKEEKATSAAPVSAPAAPCSTPVPPAPSTNNYHRDDEQVQVSLEAADDCKLDALDRQYLRLSALATVTHLKKYVAMKVLKNMDRFSEIDIILGDQPLGKDHSLKFVFITRWRQKDSHMALRYAPRIERLQL